MIQPINDIEIPATVADGIWINNIIINAPNPTQKMNALIRVTPYNVESGSLFPNLSKTIGIKDVMAAAENTSSIAIAMNSLFAAVQELVVSRSLF